MNEEQPKTFKELYFKVRDELVNETLKGSWKLWNNAKVMIPAWLIGGGLDWLLYQVFNLDTTAITMILASLGGLLGTQFEKNYRENSK